MKSSPLISAIITTKNRTGILPRALDSVLNQSYKNVEVIVVDDGSEDDTPKIIDTYQKKNPIVVIRNDRSLGACRARNMGIKRARGEFVAGLDDDDEWHPDRLSILIKKYEDSYACITSDVRMVFSTRSVVWHKKSTITLDDLMYSNQVGNQILARKDRLMDVGGFDESLHAAQDYDLWLRLCKKYGPIKNVKKPLQNIYQDTGVKRISNPETQLHGYLDFYKKHKAEMNRNQRKYQLYNIRRAQGKASTIFDIPGWVPRRKFWKEIKRWIADRFLYRG